MAQVQEEPLPVIVKNTKTHTPSGSSQDSEDFEDALDIETDPINDSKIIQDVPSSDEVTTRADSLEVQGVTDGGGHEVVDTVTMETVTVKTSAEEQPTPVENKLSADELSTDEKEHVPRRRRRASSVDSQTSEQSDTEEGDGVGVACEGGGVGGASEDDEPQKPEDPTEVQPTEERPTEEQSTEEQPEGPIEKQPTEEQATEKQPEIPTEEEPEGPTEEQPEIPTEEEPESSTEEQATEEEPEFPTEEEPEGPTEEQATEEHATEEQATEEQATEDTQNPMYVPTKGLFFQHDHRLGDDEQPGPTLEEPRSRVDRIEVWTHDLYVESQQGPRSREEKEKDARYWSNRQRDGVRGGGGRRFRRRDEDRQRPGRSRDEGRRSHDQDGRSRDEGRRSHDQDGRSRDSEGRLRDRDRRSGGGRSQGQPNRRRPYNKGSNGGERRGPTATAARRDGSPVEEWPSLGGDPATHTQPQWPVASAPTPNVDNTSHDTPPRIEPPQQNLTTLDTQRDKSTSPRPPKNNLKPKNISPKSPKDTKSSVESAESKNTPPRSKSLFNTSRQTGESGESGNSMTCSLSKSRELVVRKGRGRGRGSGRDHTPQERRVGRRPIETMTGDAYERDGSLSVTKSSPNPPATQDQESTNTNQVAQTSPSNRVSLQTNREKLAAEGGSKQPEEVLPQFPAGVGRPKRYSTRRQKTEDAVAYPSSSSLTTTPSVQPSTDGLLPTPPHPSQVTQPPHPSQPIQFDSEAHIKMFQMQQEMMASNPELLGYQAALMAQQNPMMMQQMQYLWFQQQQQQALQQSMLQGGIPAMHTLHDRPAHPSGGEIPHQQMGVAGGEGFYHSTPSGLFVPNVQHIPQQSPWQQTGGKSRSQAIPIVPPKDEP